MTEKTLAQKIRNTFSDSSVQAIHEPKFDSSELEGVKECIETGWVSTAGKFVNSFEEKLAYYVKADNCVAVVNGTSALHLALLAANVAAGDEVLLPSLTFVATANAAVYCGAVPHFVEVSEQTLCVDVKKLRNYLRESFYLKEEGLVNKLSGARVTALIVVHVLGFAPYMPELVALAKEFRLKLIEDASESLGTFVDQKHTGTFGDFGTFSFNGNKIITCGGGGAVVTNDSGAAATIKHLSTTAKMPHSWEFYHDQVGYNYRMPNLNAALGCSQLDRLTHKLEQKKRLHKLYVEMFSDDEELHVFEAPSFCESNYWLNGVRLRGLDKSRVLENCAELKIGARPFWIPLHTLPAFKNAPRMDMSATEALYNSTVLLPSSPQLLKRES